MNALTVPNGVAVALFGIALSAAFCDIHWTKKNCIILAVGSAAMLLMQALITYKGSWMAMQEAYPLTTHLPLAIILSVLNGITSEEDIEAVYPGHCLWSVAIGMDATRVGRSLTFGAPGRIQFGEKNGEMTDRVRAVDEYLTACGIASEPCSDILFKQWSKLMVNDGLNQAAAAFDLPYGGLTKPGPAYDKMLEAMQEVIDLSVLEGVNLPADNHKAFLESMAPTFKPDGMPSMRQDVLAQRPTEVEEFAGVVRARAKKYDLPTPANDFFYARIQEIEAGYCK